MLMRCRGKVIQSKSWGGKLELSGEKSQRNTTLCIKHIHSQGSGHKHVKAKNNIRDTVFGRTSWSINLVVWQYFSQLANYPNILLMTQYSTAAIYCKTTSPLFLQRTTWVQTTIFTGNGSKIFHIWQCFIQRDGKVGDMMLLGWESNTNYIMAQVSKA